MRELGLDFQPRRQRPLSLLLLCVACILCADAWIELRDHDAQLADLQVQLENAQRRADRLAMKARETARREAALPVEQSKALQQALAAIHLDWEALFRRIEESTQEDIALLAITPNAASKSLQLSGEARDLQAVLAFVDALRRQPLSRVSLLSHEIKADDPQRPILFEIAATWSNAI